MHPNTSKLHQQIKGITISLKFSDRSSLKSPGSWMPAFLDVLGLQTGGGNIRRNEE